MFDPVGICRILNDEDVAYVVVGGIATVVHGSSLPTRDLDIVPARSPANLERLGRALHRLGAQIRTGGDAVPAPLDGPFLAQVTTMLNLVTRFGDLDVVFESAGRSRDFEGWRTDATAEEVGDGLTVLVAGLDDVIDSKRAAGRPKDQMALPYLESLRDEVTDG